MAGTLFVVATPIGHLDDITVRALRVLGTVDLVAAEDTRRTGNLLRHFGLTTRILSLHTHNEGLRTAQLMARLGEGVSVAIVSDAGTPGISDPGAELVRSAREAGIRVEPIPGPSAVAAAVSVAGLDDPAFAFLGFPPTRSIDRTTWFSKLQRVQKDAAVVFFEAPHRIRKTLEELAVFVERPILVFRELTKLHEETLTGPPGELVTRLTSPRGEFTIVVPRTQTVEDEQLQLSESEWKAEIGRLTENGASSRREAARLLARRLGLPTRRVYDATRD
jgi:16S rRNA (cytidine1402-2'-O)-methyltransferase